MTPSALVIRFQEYQVAAYVVGMSEVRLPYAVVGSVIDPHSVAASWLR